VTPDRLFRRLAVTEAITWALLLTGMFLKYVTETTELGVRVFGMAHGVAFVAYCVTTVVVAVDQRWSFRRALAALACAVPPFATVPFDRYAERRGWLASSWRLADESPTGRLDAPVAWLLRNPLRGVLAGLVAVVALTGLALVVGPPAG
jgi:integral membrane protein